MQIYLFVFFLGVINKRELGQALEIMQKLHRIRRMIGGTLLWKEITEAQSTLFDLRTWKQSWTTF